MSTPEPTLAPTTQRTPLMSSSLLGASQVGRSRADVLADLVGSRIVHDSLPPGASIGTLDELREESGFARATVSEAVRMLRDRGVIEIRPGRGGGLFVADISPVVRLRRTLLSIQEEPHTVRDAIELREHLEGLIDTAAAQFCTRSDVTELKALLREMKRARSWSDFMRGNWALHERIALVCPNTMARAVYTSTLGRLTASTTTSGVDGAADPEPEYQAERYQVHVDLVESIAAGDTDAVLVVVRRHNLSA